METTQCKRLNGNEASAAMKQFVESYGGEEAMKKNYPRTYKAYQQALAYEKNSPATAANETMEEIPSITITHVAYTDDKKDHLCVEVACDMEDNSNANRQNFCVINRKTQKEIGTEGRNFAGIGNGSNSTLIIPIKGNDINDLHLTFKIQQIGKSIIPYEWEGALGDFIIEDTCTIALEHPVKKYPEHEMIDISFYGSDYPRSTKRDWDYHYPQSWSDKMFRLPSIGTIKTETKLTRITGCSLKIKNKAGKTRFHSNPVPHVFIDPTNNKIIKWNIPENWEFDFKDILGTNYNEAIYDLTIIAGTTTGNMTFSITNDNRVNKSAYRKILPGINIYTDCFPEGTQVRMQNGSQKRVEDLKEGDMVLCENNQPAKVRFKESAKTKTTLGRLVLENGTELTATPGHMIETPEGLISLNLLPAGELVKTIHGNIRVRHTEILPEKECNIVVVGLQSIHRMYVNDILAGDSEAILTEAEKAKNIRYQIPEEWRHDYDSWIAGK